MELLSLQELALNSAPSYAALSSLPVTSYISHQTSLVSQLQTSLQLQQQLDMFSMAAGMVLPLSSLTLHTAMGEYRACGSKAAAYEHRSMLLLENQCLAKLVYQSAHPFTPLVQHELLLLESEWLYPLRNALVVARLQQMALRDELTGLGNRRFFDDSFDKAVKLANRRQHSCALILLDLDNFKQVNDVAGHHTGDEVLLAVADCMRETLRETDYLFRFGGDEFAVILIQEDADSAELVAHRLVKNINQNHLCQQYKVTTSAGLALLTNNMNSQQLFQKADQALYAAKEAGKSTVRFA